MDVRKTLIIVVIVVCALSLAYGIYFQLFVKDSGSNNVANNTITNSIQVETVDFDKLFDNEINYQNYSVSNESKITQSQELVYTNYTLTEIYEGKYDVKVSIPVININNEKITNINKEITQIFQDKVSSILANRNNEDITYTVYTVEYTAYLNENILSLAIKSTLKEGDNAQRLIIKTYTYNLSTNEEIPLSSMLTIKGKNTETVERTIKQVIQESISNSDNLAALGYTVYERDINSSIYQVANSNNYLLGPNGTIYIIYAYGNTSYTSEKDVVVIE